MRNLLLSPIKTVVAGSILLGLLVSQSVLAEVSVDAACAAFEGIKRTNCLIAFSKIPNDRALAYTLKFLLTNANGLKDPSCVRHANGIAKDGIRNSCQFVLNDLTSVYEANPLRAHGYFVDLCSKDTSKTVQGFYVNKGSGSANGNYSDREGAHTSNAGAYLTATEVREFVPIKETAAYGKLEKNLGGKIPALNLVGLHSTNNNTSSGKPMHASPYRSSWGCPSVSPSAVGIMKALADNGPSLVMNYGPAQLHPEKSLTKCDAVPDVVGGKTFGRRGKHGGRGRSGIEDYLPRGAVRLKTGRIRMVFPSATR